jgi:hypothetical protein
MSHPKSLVLGTLAAGLASVVLTGCTTASPAAQRPTSAPAVPSSTPSTPAQPTAAAPTSAVRTESTPPAGQGGSAGRSDVDFEKVMFTRLGCPDFEDAHRRAEVFAVKRADLTGDGRREAVVAAACFTNTAANPARVIIFDGADAGNPRPLVSIGENQDLVTATVQIKGKTVTVTSKALSAKASRCCPDRLITQTYAWQGNGFSRVRLQERNLAS